MVPSEDVIVSTFSSQHPLRQPAKHPQLSGAPDTRRREPFPAWSVVDDTKKKADAFAKEASREFNVASQKAQAKTGKIELWSPKYYAACTVGGLLACVGPHG
jgi:solute carrier family 25 phosphate transporter 3